MSGIVGFYNLNSQSLDSAVLEKMVEKLAHRGSDDVGIWQDESVGLGHGMLWTTPESLLEKLPLKDSTGNLILTADARIDNRDELISALELNDLPAEKITDSDLILAAYEKWGRECPGKLIGDFAFAIWDKCQQVLFCARDYMGVKPFFYNYQPGKLFAFASEIKGLFCLDTVPRKVNDAKVGIYLCQLSGYAKLKPDTFYQDILRLLPAHWIEVSEQGIESASFWDLDAEAKKIQQSLTTDAEYVEEFRKRFTEAIACRLRSAYPVASTLSGGVDSSSVSCVARNLLQEQDSNAELNTIYNDCESPDCDEKPWANTILAQGGFNHTIVKVSNPISSAQTVIPWLDEPVRMPTPAMLLAILESAQKQGNRIILTGYDGDTVVCHGTDYLNELVELGEWEKVKKIVEMLYQNKANQDDDSIEKEIEQELYSYVVPYAQELVRKFEFHKYPGLIHNVFNKWGFSHKRIVKLILRSIYNNLHNLKWNKCNSNIKKSFAKSIDLDKLVTEQVSHSSAYLPSQYKAHYKGIKSGNLQAGTEQLDPMGAALSVEFRHPFLDKRLVELCLAAPSHIKFCNSYGRGVMRRGMEGILSEEVRHRRSKADFFGFIVPAIKEQEQDFLEDLLWNKQTKISKYLNTKKMAQDYQNILYSPKKYQDKIRKAKLISRASYLEIWLNNQS